jgi:UPF0755 protein
LAGATVGDSEWDRINDGCANASARLAEGRAVPALHSSMGGTAGVTDRGDADNGDPFVPPVAGRGSGVSQPPGQSDGAAPPRSFRPFAPRSPRAALEPERVPLPTRRSQRVRHPLVVAGNAVFTILILVAIIAGGALFIGKQRFDAAGPLTEEKTVNIPKGLGTRDIADLLTREGVIDQPWVFIGGVVVLKAREGLKYGEYRFPKSASISDVVDIIVEGRVVQHTLTFPEGLTSEQIVARLLESDLLTGTIKEVPREGTLLPETYKVTRGVSRQNILNRMQQASRKMVQEVWERRSPDLPLKSPEELVTLASIVEKETGKPDERTRVAAVFVNRLKQKMRLQSDPTIIYGLVGGKGSLGRPLSKGDIEQPTPYNTYIVDGLPPGPIANPGRASLEATANPARTKEIYFVADGTGGHVFSDNYEQHRKNVAKLRAIERGDAQPAPPANGGGTGDNGPPSLRR